MLAFLFGEQGGEEVERVIDRAAISAINLSEVVAKQVDRGVSAEIIKLNLADADLTVLPFDAAMAVQAGELREATRAAGLSLADRACLATALSTRLDIMTADRAWGALDIGVTIQIIR